MKRVIRVVKAIPWVMLWRLGFKALCVLSHMLVMMLTIFWKTIVFLLSKETKGQSESFASDDRWAAFAPDAKWNRPDLVTFTNKEDE